MAARNCSELSETIAKLALDTARRDDIRDLDDVLEELQDELPELSREELVFAINEYTERPKRKLSDVQKKLQRIKREAWSDEALHDRIANLSRHLEEGTLPSRTLRPSTRSKALEELHSIAKDLRSQLNKSKAKQKERLLSQILDLQVSLRSPFEAPKPKAEPLLDKEILQLREQRNRLRDEAVRRVNAHAPKTIWGVTKETTNFARTVMTSVDFSAALRQAGFITYAHPIRAAHAFGESLKAFKSQEAAMRIREELYDRDNAPLYAAGDLYFSRSGDFAERLNAHEEAVMSRWAERVPVIRNFQRSYTIMLDVLRADSFDAMARSLGKNGAITIPEAKAIANFVNKATGRGSLGKKGEAAAEGLNTIFFAPRYVASRFQLLAGQPFYKGTARTRVVIAKEYARYLAGISVVYALAELNDEAEIEWDRRSSDFGKIKIGNTRIDPLSGLSQVTVLATRLKTGETKSLSTGEIKPLKGPDKPYGSPGVLGTVTNFLRSKLAPVPGAAVSLVVGETPDFKEAKAGELAAGLIVPMNYGDIKDALEEQDVPTGVAMGVLATFGMGLQTFEPKESRSRARGEPREPREAQ